MGGEKERETANIIVEKSSGFSDSTLIRLQNAFESSKSDEMVKNAGIL